jgi:hypothetical protein
MTSAEKNPGWWEIPVRRLSKNHTSHAKTSFQPEVTERDENCFANLARLLMVSLCFALYFCKPYSQHWMINNQIHTAGQGFDIHFVDCGISLRRNYFCDAIKLNDYRIRSKLSLTCGLSQPQTRDTSNNLDTNTSIIDQHRPQIIHCDCNDCGRRRRTRSWT